MSKLALLEKIGFVPTEGQIPMLMSRARLRLVAGGERAGKSRSGAADVLADAMKLASDEEGKVLVWLVGNEYADCREEFRYMLEDLLRLEVVQKYSFPTFGPCTLLARWEGAALEIETKVPKGLVARAPHFILGCEAPRMNYEAYLSCLGRLSQRNGRLLLTGTFVEDFGWYSDLWNAWQTPHTTARAIGADTGELMEWLGDKGGVSFSLPTWSNLYEYPGGRDDPKVLDLEKAYKDIPGWFDSKCGGVPTPPVGLVFRDFSHLTHVGSVVYRPGSPVYLGVDPSRGVNPYAVVVCQVRMGDEISVIDEIYERGMICEDIIEIARTRPWWKDVVRFGTGGAIGHDAPDDKKRWQKLGTVKADDKNGQGITLATKNIKEEHLIRRVKTFLHTEGEGRETRPRLLIDASCKNGIKEFATWRRGDNNKPIDKDNHWLKGLGYWLINKFGFVEELGKPRRRSYTKQKYTGLAQRSLYA